MRPALPLVLGDRDRPAERAGQPLFEIADRGRFRRAAGGRCASRTRGAARCGLAQLLDERLGRTDRELLVDDLARRPLDRGCIVEGEQGAGMAHRELLVLDELAHRRRQACNSRIAFATVLRSLPIRSATWSCVSPN